MRKYKITETAFREYKGKIVEQAVQIKNVKCNNEESMPLGLIPSPIDDRDYSYSNMRAATPKLPDRFMITPVGEVRDQGVAGSCVGFAAAAIQEADDMTNGGSEYLSPLYIYTKCKAIDGIPSVEGTYLRTAMKVLSESGVCPEKVLPYSTPEDYRRLKLPEINNATNMIASERKIVGYARLNTLDDILQAIYNENGAILGVLATDSLMNPQKEGLIGLLDGTIHGGHALAAVGWDKNKEVEWIGSSGGKYSYTGVLYVRNSWGRSWGANGYGMIPLDLIDISKVEQAWDFKFINEAWTTIHEVKPDGDPDFHKKANDPRPSISDDIIIKLKQGSYTMTVNGKNIPLKEPVTNINGRIMTPIREIFEVVGGQVIWDNDLKEAIVIFRKED